MAKLRILDSGFAQVPNEILSDKKLSMKEKGLFCYMQSKPDNWEFSGRRVAEDMNDGVKAVWNVMRSLEKKGFLERKRYKDAQGKWDWEHILKNPYRPFGSTENGSTEKGGNKKEGYNNKEDISTNVDIVEKSKEEPETEFSSEDWIKSLSESPQPHIRLIAYYFGVYSEHNLPTKKVAQDEMAKNLKPAVFLVNNYDKKDIAKTLKYCKEKFADVHWNLATVKKQISYVTAKKD